MTVRTESCAWLDDAARTELHRRVAGAIASARRRGRRVVASLSVVVDPALDVSATMLAARRPEDRWFLTEQPERGGHAIAALGEAARVEAAGADRFRVAAEACRAALDGAFGGDPAADPGPAGPSGPVWVGGFAFAPDGGAAPEWSSLAPAQFVLPEVALLRRDRLARLTVAAALEGDEHPDAVIDRLEARLAEVRPAAMPLLDPHPVSPPRVAGASPPSHYEEAVRRAVERIRAGEISKIVLAREVRVHASRPIDPAPVFDGLRAAFPGCFCFMVGTPELAFLGASPELLVRREGARAQSVALAGTTTRSADPAVDDHLGQRLMGSEKDRGEQRIVAERIERVLDPVSVWVAAADEPVLAKVQNVQHLATPIRAQLAAPVPVIELAGRLHPTPAVGGEPAERALPLIPALEGMDRGWYAGTVGWTDASEDGEFCVAVRCGLIRERVAHLYAGCGIVADSDPAAELAEADVKLVLLPLLA